MKILKYLSLLLGILALTPLNAAWGPVVTISGTVSSDPQIGVDDAGNAIAIWKNFDGVKTNIQVATQSIGGAWSAPLTIASSLGNNIQGTPQIAVNASGNAVAIWEELNGGLSTVRSRRLPFGGSWSTPTDILSVPTAISAAQIPQVAIDPAGNAVAVWMRHDGVTNIVQSSVLIPFAGTWSAPVDISIIGQDSFSPQVSVDASGNAVAVWAGVGIGADFIYAATLPFGGTWSTPVALSGLLASGPQVAVNAAGYAVAVWGINIAGNFFVQAATLTGGVWSAAVNISTGGFAVFGAQVAVDPAGNAIAVWPEFTGGDVIIQSARLPFGGSWSSPPDNLSPTGAFSLDPQIAVDAAGNAIAIWDRNNFADIIIQAAMLPFGGSWSTPPDDISTAGQISSVPQIAMTPNGYAVVDWTNESLEVIQSIAWVPNPTPPPSFTGQVKTNRFLDKKECALLATWTPSTAPGIVAYIIYDGNTAVARIPATGPFVYKTCIPCNAVLNFSIAAVNFNGVESARIPITIIP